MNLTIAILDFGVRLYGGSELSKHKMLATDAKNAKKKKKKIEPDPNFFYDGRKFRRQCVNVIDITWGRIYFSTCENFGRKIQTPCAMALLKIFNAINAGAGLGLATPFTTAASVFFLERIVLFRCRTSLWPHQTGDVSDAWNVTSAPGTSHGTEKILC